MAERRQRLVDRYILQAESSDHFIIPLIEQDSIGGDVGRLVIWRFSQERHVGKGVLGQFERMAIALRERVS